MSPVPSLSKVEQLQMHIGRDTTKIVYKKRSARVKHNCQSQDTVPHAMLQPFLDQSYYAVLHCHSEAISHEAVHVLVPNHQSHGHIGILVKHDTPLFTFVL